MQSDLPAPDGAVRIDRTAHRIPAGSTIRDLLQQVGGTALVDRVVSGDRGLARHGRRAWLDDRLRDGDRVELVAVIVADAKAVRRARVVSRTAARMGPPGA